MVTVLVHTKHSRASGPSNMSRVCVKGLHDMTKTWAIPEAHVAWRQHPGPRYVVFGDKDGVGAVKPISYVPIFSHFFYNIKILIFYKKYHVHIDRCRLSLATVTSIKYGCDLKNFTCSFTRSKFPVAEKLTNRALVTPPLVRQGIHVWFNQVHRFTALMNVKQSANSSVQY